MIAFHGAGSAGVVTRPPTAATAADMTAAFSGANAGITRGYAMNHDKIVRDMQAAGRSGALDDSWRPMDTAPKDGTAFQAIIPGHGSDNVIVWTDGLLNAEEQDCGSWCFVEDQEPPDCWTDGVCWTENEYGEPSVPPTAWKPLKERRDE